MTPRIEAAIRGFKEIILGGIPLLLKQNETALLSFMCSLAATDALSGYRYATDNVGDRFKDFIREYFPACYAPHAENLYLLRCRLLHNFSPAHFTLVHANPSAHLQKSVIGDTALNDADLFADLARAASRFFGQVQTDESLQNTMNARLLNIEKGGAIHYE